MSDTKQFPKSIRFDSDTQEKVNKLTEVFDESIVKVLHRAVDYLYENQEASIDAEALKRKSRL